MTSQSDLLPMRMATKGAVLSAAISDSVLICWRELSHPGLECNHGGGFRGTRMQLNVFASQSSAKAMKHAAVSRWSGARRHSR